MTRYELTHNDQATESTVDSYPTRRAAMRVARQMADRAVTGRRDRRLTIRSRYCIEVHDALRTHHVFRVRVVND